MRKEKQVVKSMIVLLAVGLSCGALTGCHITASTPSGLREYHRGLNGLVVTGKSAPNTLDEYHKTQRETDRTSLELLQMQLQGEK
jgi:surfactin synthase thioesterase subunit